MGYNPPITEWGSDRAPDDEAAAAAAAVAVDAKNATVAARDDVVAGLATKMNKSASNASSIEKTAFRKAIAAEPRQSTVSLRSLAEQLDVTIPPFDYGTGGADTPQSAGVNSALGVGFNPLYPTEVVIDGPLLIGDVPIRPKSNVTLKSKGGVLIRKPTFKESLPGDAIKNFCMVGDDVPNLRDFAVEDFLVLPQRQPGAGGDADVFGVFRIAATDRSASNIWFRRNKVRGFGRQHSAYSIIGVVGGGMVELQIFDGGGPTDLPYQHGIYIRDSSDWFIDDVEMRGLQGAGIKIMGDEDAYLENTRINNIRMYGGTRALQIAAANGVICTGIFGFDCLRAAITTGSEDHRASKNIDISASQFRRGTMGIRGYKTSGLRIHDSIFDDVPIAVRFRSTPNSVLKDNKISCSAATVGNIHMIEIDDARFDSDLVIDGNTLEMGNNGAAERIMIYTGAKTDGAVRWGDKNTIRGRNNMTAPIANAPAVVFASGASLDGGGLPTGTVLVGGSATSAVVDGVEGLTIGAALTIKVTAAEDDSLVIHTAARTCATFDPVTNLVTWSGGALPDDYDVERTTISWPLSAAGKIGSYPGNAPGLTVVNAADLNGDLAGNAVLPGAHVWVPDLGPGPGEAVSDGVAWRRVDDDLASAGRPIVNDLRTPMERMPGMSALVAAVRGGLGAAPTGTVRYQGSVLAPNGKIYGAPYDNTQGILIIDTSTTPATASVSLMGLASLTGSAKWQGGVLAPNGKIYCVPYDYAGGVLIIDPVANTATISMMGLAAGSLADTGKWKGACLGRDGKIYCIPYNANDILIIDPAAGTAVRSTMGLTMSGTGKWHGGVVGPHGKIFGIPYGSGTILIIDTIAGVGSFSTMGATIAGAAKWQGGVLGPDGCIYGIPANAADILKIDPSMMKASRSNMGAAITGTANWRCGVLGPDGKIYGIPHTAQSFLIIDPVRGVAITSTLGAISLTDTLKWSGGNLATDGNIYAMPAGTVDTLTIGKFPENYASGCCAART